MSDPRVRSRPVPLACYDCGLLYGGPGWCDVVVRDEDWLAISPTGHEGGVLCFNCIAVRLHALGMSGVPMMVTSGPFGSGRSCRSCGTPNAACLIGVAKMGRPCCRYCHDDDAHPTCGQPPSNAPVNANEFGSDLGGSDG